MKNLKDKRSNKKNKGNCESENNQNKLSVIMNTTNFLSVQKTFGMKFKIKKLALSTRNKKKTFQ